MCVCVGLYRVYNLRVIFQRAINFGFGNGILREVGGGGGEIISILILLLARD